MVINQYKQNGIEQTKWWKDAIMHAIETQELDKNCFSQNLNLTKLFTQQQWKLSWILSKSQSPDLPKFPSRGKTLGHPNCAKLLQDFQISSLEVDASKAPLCSGKGFVLILGLCSAFLLITISPASIISWTFCLSALQPVVGWPGATEWQAQVYCGL